MELLEAKGVLRGGWLDGREIGKIDKEELIALGPGIVPPEGGVFLASSGRTLKGKVKMVRYIKTELFENNLVVFEYVGEVE